MVDVVESAAPPFFRTAAPGPLPAAPPRDASPAEASSNAHPVGGIGASGGAPAPPRLEESSLSSIRKGRNSDDENEESEEREGEREREEQAERETKSQPTLLPLFPPSLARKKKNTHTKRKREKKKGPFWPLSCFFQHGTAATRGFWRPCCDANSGKSRGSRDVAVSSGRSRSVVGGTIGTAGEEERSRRRRRRRCSTSDRHRSWQASPQECGASARRGRLLQRRDRERQQLWEQAARPRR